MNRRPDFYRQFIASEKMAVRSLPAKGCLEARPGSLGEGVFFSEYLAESRQTRQIWPRSAAWRTLDANSMNCSKPGPLPKPCMPGWLPIVGKYPTTPASPGAGLQPEALGGVDPLSR